MTAPRVDGSDRYHELRGVHIATGDCEVKLTSMITRNNKVTQLGGNGN
jgi:hypothetical protein